MPNVITATSREGLSEHAPTVTPSVVDDGTFYDEHYDAALWEGNVGRAIALVHRRMERGITERFDRVLEVGAGSGQHRAYVNHPYETYVETDLRVRRATREIESTGREVIREFADAGNLAYPDASFDRLVATCLLMHLCAHSQRVPRRRPPCELLAGAGAVMEPELLRQLPGASPMNKLTTTGVSVCAGASAVTALSRTRSLLLNHAGAYDEANHLWVFSQRMARLAAAAGIVTVAATVGARH